jgi:hypothetical protein
MTIIGKIHFTLVALINLVLVGKLINTVWGGNDKAILLVLLGYPALIFLNSIVWAILSGLKRPESKIYKIMAIALLALFLPTLMLSSMY